MFWNRLSTRTFPLWPSLSLQRIRSCWSTTQAKVCHLGGSMPILQRLVLLFSGLSMCVCVFYQQPPSKKEHLGPMAPKGKLCFSHPFLKGLCLFGGVGGVQSQSSKMLADLMSRWKALGLELCICDKPSPQVVRTSGAYGNSKIGWEIYRENFLF